MVFTRSQSRSVTPSTKMASDRIDDELTEFLSSSSQSTTTRSRDSRSGSRSQSLATRIANNRIEDGLAEFATECDDDNSSDSDSNVDVRPATTERDDNETANLPAANSQEILGQFPTAKVTANLKRLSQSVQLNTSQSHSSSSGIRKRSAESELVSAC